MPKKRVDDDCPPPNFVSRAECAAISTDLKADLKILKHALVGDDMRGGMVKDISNLTNKVDGIVANRVTDNTARQEEKKNELLKTELSLRWKIALGVAALGSLTAVIVEILHLL